ncbi:hypothetical protein INT48_004973, partial [Thamnidium elegans]
RTLTTLANAPLQFKDVKRLFYSINHTKPRNFKVLYYKTLSRNHILDISDTTPGSPLMLLTNNVRTNIIESFKGPEFDKRELENLVKLVKNMKTTNRGLKTALNQLKLITKKDSDTTTSTSVLKFILKKHLEEAHLFEIPLINSFSECDYVVKFWGPLVEKGFKNTSIIPHWGDTFPGSLLTLGIRMKMDLRLIAIDKNQFEDHGYGEVAKQGSVPKYFKDKRKAVIACKALLNSIITSNAIDQEKESVFIPYLIVMGFEMHLYVVHLKSNHFYITQKVKSIAFPSRLADFGEESIELANGLLDLVVNDV